MNKNVKKLIEVFNNKLDIFDASMNTGLTHSERVDFENYIGQKLPDAYSELLQKYNGEKRIICCMAGFGFSSIDEIKLHWDLFNSSPMIIPNKIYQKNKIYPLSYSNKRIPFASDGSGNFLCLDFLPNVEGKEGQIIYLPLGEDEPISVIADSFDDFLIFLIKALEDESLALVDEREDWGEEDWEKAGIYFFSSWRDDWTDIAENYNNQI